MLHIATSVDMPRLRMRQRIGVVGVVVVWLAVGVNGIGAQEGNSLSDEEFERLMSRMMGTWEVTSVQVLDGRSNPVEGADYEVARTPVDEFTVAFVSMRDGKPSTRNTQVFSADGQRMTIVFRAADRVGEPISAVWVWDKVADPAP